MERIGVSQCLLRFSWRTRKKLFFDLLAGVKLGVGHGKCSREDEVEVEVNTRGIFPFARTHNGVTDAITGSNEVFVYVPLSV